MSSRAERASDKFARARDGVRKTKQRKNKVTLPNFTERGTVYIKKDEYRLAVWDIETDPFDRDSDRIIPFSWEFMAHHGDAPPAVQVKWCLDYVPDLAWCAETFFDYLDTLEEPHLIYAHNGGKFDFLFILNELQKREGNSAPRIIGSTRIGEFRYKHHVLRDSWLFVPEKLKSSGGKLDIDYDRLKRHNRDKHRKEILTYLHADCDALLNRYLVPLIREFGCHLTQPTAAWKRMIQIMREEVDEKFDVGALDEKGDSLGRPFYSGGRTNCFEHGIIRPRRGRLKVYDMNGAYAGAMRNLDHPIGVKYETQIGGSLDKDRWDFAVVRLRYTDEVLPWREKTKKDTTAYGTGELRFPRASYNKPRLFWISYWEYQVAKEFKRIEVFQVVRIIRFKQRSNFAPFIDKMKALRDHHRKLEKQAFDEKNEREEAFHNVMQLGFKRMMNATYGKMAQNARKFTDDLINDGEVPDDDDYKLVGYCDPSIGAYAHWRKPSEAMRGFRNVWCAASITGAVRAWLARSLLLAERKLYCDTDSIICENLPGEYDGELGSFKLEAEADVMAICGKKTYAMIDTSHGTMSKEDAEAYRDEKFGIKSKGAVDAKYVDDKVGYYPCIKLATKGGRYTPEQIFKTALGSYGIQVWDSPAPTMGLDGRQKYMSRELRNTAKIERFERIRT